MIIDLHIHTNLSFVFKPDAGDKDWQRDMSCIKLQDTYDIDDGRREPGPATLLERL